MRFVAVGIILASLPVFIACLSRYRNCRDLALGALGVLLFLSGELQVDAAIITWPLWPGTATGLLISPMDTLSLALIFTRARSRSYVPFLFLALIYTLPFLLSVLVSFNPMASAFVSFQALRVIIMFVAVAGEVHRPRALRNLLTGIAIGLLIHSGFVLFDKISGVVQAKGAMIHQNVLGMMVELSVIPLIVALMAGEQRKLIYAGTVAGLFILASGGSRAAMTLTGVGIVLVILLELIRRPTVRKLKLVTLALLMAAVIVPVGLGTLKERFGEAPVTLESDEQRPAFERAAKAMSKDYPLGVGANNYVSIANTRGYSLNAGVDWGGNNLTAPVHNSYLLMRAETGWFGQLVMLLLLTWPIYAGLRLAFSDRGSPSSAMGSAVATAFAITALHNNYEYAWHYEVVQRIFFANLAMLSGCIIAHRYSKMRMRTSGKVVPS